jgi:putative hemolysin
MVDLVPRPVEDARMWQIELLVMVTMIGINSILAAYELALTSVTLARLELLVAEKRNGASAAMQMKRNMEGSLAGVQLGITLVGAIAGATGGAGAGQELVPGIQQWLGVSSGLAEFLAIATVVVPLTFATIIFGELIPKIFALRNREWVCLRLSPSMKRFVSVVYPMVWLLESIVARFTSWGERRLQGKLEDMDSSANELQELRASAALARTSRLIGPRQEQIILGATELSSQPIGEIMIPADGISMLEADGSVADALITAHLDMHTRFPLTEQKGDPQAIVGYVNFKDIVAHMRLAPQGPSLRKVMRPIPSFVETMPIAQCLERLIRDHVHIALIRNAANQVVGLITLEDLLETLVGEIEDEFDHLPTHAVVSGRGWVVGGGIRIDQLREITGINLPTSEAESPPQHLSEWVEQRCPQPIRGGERIDADGIRILIRKVRRQKVLEAQIERLPG